MSRKYLKLGDRVKHNWRDVKGIYLCRFMRDSHFILLPHRKTNQFQKFHFDAGKQLPSYIEIWSTMAIIKHGKPVKLTAKYLDPYTLHIIAQYRSVKNRRQPSPNLFTYKHHLEYRHKLNESYQEYIDQHGYTAKVVREARKILSPFVKGMQNRYEYYSIW